MPTLSELKASSPAYAQMSDMEFASKVYRKHYADKMSFTDFAKKADFHPYAMDADPAKGQGAVATGFAGAGKSLVDLGRGVRNLATDAGRYFVESNPVLFGGHIGGDTPTAQHMRDKVAAQKAEQDAIAKRDAPLMHTGAGKVGYVAGVAAQTLLPGAGLRGTVVGRALLPTTLPGMAAQGAAYGLVQPVGSNDSRLLNTGEGGLAGLVGGAIPAGGSRLAGLVAKPFRVFTPAGENEAVASVLRGAATDASKLTTPQPSAIPGVNRTLAEESLDPGVAQLQRMIAAKHGGEFDVMRRQNNLARSNALQQFAGDDAAIAAAKQARSTAANPLRRDALQIEGVDTNRLLSQVKRLEVMHEGRPAVQAGLAQIRSLLTRQVPDAERMKAAIQPLQDFIASDRTSATNREAAKAAIAQIKGGEWPAQTFGAGQAGSVGVGASSDAAKAALAQARKALQKTHVGHDKVAVLDNVRKTIGDMLSGKYGGESAAALSGSRELMAVKSQLDRVLAKQAPQYGQYIDTFRSASKPINRMELGQTLLDSGTGKTRDPLTGAYTIMPGAFGGQVKNLDAAAAKATGFPKARAADILQPQDFATIRGIDDDLSRQSFADTAGRGPGSDTFQKFMTQGNAIAAMKAIGVNVPGTGILKLLGNAGTERINKALAAALANPQQARAILSSVSPTERRIIEQMLSQAGGRLGVVLPPVAKQLMPQAPSGQ